MQSKPIPLQDAALNEIIRGVCPSMQEAEMPIRIALYQPDIAPNAATIIRMAACFGLQISVIEPAGFVWSDSGFRRAGMDYLDLAQVVRVPSWAEFRRRHARDRLILMTTGGNLPLHQFRFAPDDIILMGRESAGVPEAVHEAAAARLTIPMAAGTRSLNVAMACAMASHEALRQLGGFPAGDGSG
jgi:tRNA (cytidine/uridine-2'-O-)-methyltransferase